MVSEERENARRIKEKGRDLGFLHVGIARAERLAEERALLDAWLVQGRHATMRYMERDAARRTNPEVVLPGCVSVISVASNYYTAHGHSGERHTGKISRYAWGDDYHEVLLPKLKELAAFVSESVPGSETRVYIDTGPLMEKAWAVRAGVGWLGKHTNVINRSHGSWFFLGEVLTTAKLACDTPVEDRCGTCTACIDACPTRAITGPYELDASRCISYFTIEMKGDAPAGVEEMDFKSWIFGCDICQDVCPWNSFATPTAERAFEPRPELLHPALAEITEMDADTFRARFRGSPVKRAKLAGLVRNARIVLAQMESHTGN